MFDHNLEVVKGPSLMHRLDFAAAPKAGESINEGSLMSVDVDGLLIAGCPAGAAAVRPMPVFAIQGIDDFDANSDEGNMSGGVMSGVVATGGFEISTTEFEGTVFVPNQLLTAGSTAGTVAAATVSPYGAEPIVGVVTKAPYVNADGKSVLTFWTTFIPAGS
jgi:hypothetical protein